MLQVQQSVPDLQAALWTFKRQSFKAERLSMWLVHWYDDIDISDITYNAWINWVY